MARSALLTAVASTSSPHEWQDGGNGPRLDGPSTRIHLMGATVLTGSQLIDVGFWRGALLAVDGWHIGDGLDQLSNG